MLDFLYQIDLTIFYFLNHTLSNSLFDKFFPFITEVKHWYLVYAIFWLILVIKGGRLGRITAVMMILLVTVSDQLSSSLIKNWVGRIRPCNELPDVNILAGCTSSFSFPSSHAVNNFAAAVFFSILYPRYKWAFFTVAFLLAISRPYAGVHYPSDIIGGALIGSLIGYLFALAVKQINKLFQTKT
ncbi:MAG: phosphatase PAP2 family protein [Melioribacteraceae bacterium]|nr:phosphatase PAP2 family protein [Melioribacteraceae bacterium]